MNRTLALSFAALPLLLSACAALPPEVFHDTDPSALVVESFDVQTAQLVKPTPTDKIKSAEILVRATKLSPHQTAIIMLEDYPETVPGALFRDRSLDWFVGLRGLGYQHIFFLKGNGSGSPGGLVILAEYD